MEGEGGVRVVDQWDRGESHEGPVAAVDLDSKKRKRFSSLQSSVKQSVLEVFFSKELFFTAWGGGEGEKEGENVKPHVSARYQSKPVQKLHPIIHPSSPSPPPPPALNSQ